MPKESADEPEKNPQISRSVNSTRNMVLNHGQRGSGTGMRYGLSICHTLYAYGLAVNT